ncbi:MAG: hypothetical protein KG003_02580 [Bacteroidetes bacterium]|nr:hypothetical protein [Bacteroidota bacterium]
MLGSAALAFFWSAIKYLIGAALSMVVFTNPLLGFFVTTTGAITGIIFFTYGGLWIEEKFRRRFLSKGKHFNRRTRLLVRLKRSGGLPLVAFLTPIILSIPLGCIMATAFIHSRTKIVVYMTLSVVFWGSLIFGSAGFFHLNLADRLSGVFDRLWIWLVEVF